METFTYSSSKLVFDKYGEIRLYSAPRDPCMTRVENGFLKIQRTFHPPTLQLTNGERRFIQPLCSLSPNSQADLGSLKSESEEIDESRTVRVRFQLQKECSFGEQFLIVGDDPMFGLWNPLNAVPLTWSDGHIWTVELDIPVGKSIQFKFILKEATGNFLWQPGPDRSFQTWETERIITVCEDWGNAELQSVVEEDEPALPVNELPVDKPEDVVIAETETEPVPLLSPEVIGQEVQLMAENISVTTENPLVNARKKTLQSETGNDSSSERKTDASNENSLVPDDSFGNSGESLKVDQAGTEDNEGYMINHEGDPVLVPGLPPLHTETAAEPAAEAIISEEGTESNDILFQFHDIKDQSLPEEVNH